MDEKQFRIMKNRMALEFREMLAQEAAVL